uniref:Uncharacterized protein n=1 Tax=Arcella intermedia TaxID=1963864 RepID=A0A6B2KWM5_9EUKA
MVGGLSSAEEGGRLGASVALTEVLHCFPIITLTHFCDTLLKTYPPKATIKGECARDESFALVFGYSALARSGRLELELAGPAPQQAMHAITTALTTLLDLATRKSFLPEVTYETVLGILDRLPKDRISEVISVFSEVLGMDPKEYSPEMISLLICLKRNFSVKFNEYSSYLTKHGILHPTNIHLIKNALVATSYSSPRMHSVWNYVVDVLSDSPVAHFQAFAKVLDDIFLIEQTSVKHMAFQVVQLFSEKIETNRLPYLFTANFIKSLVNALVNVTHILHKAVKQTLYKLIQVLKTEPLAAMAAVNALEGPSGIINFDKKTRTKTISTLLTVVSSESANSYANELLEQFINYGQIRPDSFANDNDKYENAIVAGRKWIVDQLINLIKGKLVQNRELVVLNILKFLFFHSFYTYEPTDNDVPNLGEESLFLTKQPSPPICVLTRSYVTQRFFSTLSFINKTSFLDENDKQPAKGKPVKGKKFLHEGESWSYHIFKFQHKLNQNKDFKVIFPHKSPSNDDEMDVIQNFDATLQALTAKITEIRKQKKQLKTVEDLETKTKLHKLITFESLMLNIGLTFFSNPGELTPAIQELCTIYDNLFNTDKDSSRAIEVMTDLFVSWLVRPASLVMRETIEQTFKAFCPSLTVEGLDILLGVLQQKLDQKEDEEEEEEEEEEEGEEVGEGEEEGEGEEGEGEGGEEDDEDDEDEEEEEGGLDDDAKTRLQKVLEKLGQEKPGEEESEDESSMDDEQMFKLDKNIEDMLKLRKDSKKASKQFLQDRRDIIQFKQRVLSLIDLYITQQQHDQQQNHLNNKTPVHAILPLLQAIGTSASSGNTDTINLVQRIEVVFNRLCKPAAKNCVRASSEDVPFYENILTALMEKATTTKLPNVSRMCAVGISFIMRILLHAPSTKTPNEAEDNFGLLNLDTFKENITKCLNSFLLSKQKSLTNSFFQTVLLQFPKVGWQVVPIISSLLPKSQKKKPQICCLDWLLALIRMKKELGNAGARFLPVAGCFYQTFSVVSRNPKNSLPDMRKCLSLLIIAVQTSIKLQGLEKTKEAFPIDLIDKQIKEFPSTLLSNPSIVGLSNVIRNLFTGETPKQKSKQKKNKNDGKAPNNANQQLNNNTLTPSTEPKPTPNDTKTPQADPKPAPTEPKAKGRSNSKKGAGAPASQPASAPPANGLPKAQQPQEQQKQEGKKRRGGKK